nr:MAG TPA: hypothetical protein [Caudoviricetes sp.]
MHFRLPQNQQNLKRFQLLLLHGQNCSLLFCYI